MDYSKKIESVRKRIEELNQIKELLYNIEDTVYSIEKEVSALDNSLPSDKEVRSMGAGTEKEQLLHLIDLLSQSYGLIDEILGPPEDQVTGEPAGSAFTPEARGNSNTEISIDEILKHFPGSGRGSAS